jgi:myo-inositol-1(or 4)-monophosphatase
MNLSNPLKEMTTIAVEAGDMLYEMQPDSHEIHSKKDILADGDLASEKMILGMLGDKFPDIPVYSEETGGTPSKAGWLWIVDPVDGTGNFLCQDNLWGVSIALVKDSQSVAGVVYLPCDGYLYYATNVTTAKRCMVHEKEIISCDEMKTHPEKRLSRSRVWTDWVKGSASDHEQVLKTFAQLSYHTLYPQIRVCCTASMVRVASGSISAYVHIKPQPFDIAAAGLIVQQAGGKVTDLAGNPWNPFSPSIIASNGPTHKELLRILKS